MYVRGKSLALLIVKAIWLQFFFVPETLDIEGVVT